MVRGIARTFSPVQRFCIERGFNESVNKAVRQAFDEEQPFSHNRVVMAFIAYVLFKTFFRYYKEVTKNFYFRTGVVKFVAYALDRFFPGVALDAWKNIYSEVIEIGKRKP